MNNSLAYHSFNNSSSASCLNTALNGPPQVYSGFSSNRISFGKGLGNVNAEATHSRLNKAKAKDSNFNFNAKPFEPSGSHPKIDISVFKVSNKETAHYQMNQKMHTEPSEFLMKRYASLPKVVEGSRQNQQRN